MVNNTGNYKTIMGSSCAVPMLCTDGKWRWVVTDHPGCVTFDGNEVEVEYESDTEDGLCVDFNFND